MRSVLSRLSLYHQLFHEQMRYFCFECRVEETKDWVIQQSDISAFGTYRFHATIQSDDMLAEGRILRNDMIEIEH